MNHNFQGKCRFICFSISTSFTYREAHENAKSYLNIDFRLFITCHVFAIISLQSQKIFRCFPSKPCTEPYDKKMNKWTLKLWTKTKPSKIEDKTSVWTKNFHLFSNIYKECLTFKKHSVAVEWYLVKPEIWLQHLVLR